MNQPVALVCRETLIANLEALDWKITPRDMKYKEELEPAARYYTRLIRNGGNYPELGLDYSGLLEWVIGDMLDLPFGGFAEVGRRDDTEGGRVSWIKPIDAGTMYPTLNRDFPSVQYVYGYDAVPFPQHAQSRIMWSPNPILIKEGWGIAPPEKIYFALELLNRGDKYYANLLLDIPAAGILDLGDMEASAAKEWIDSFRTFVNDQTTAFKIPVLYEHNNSVNFIPLGKVPNDILFDKVTMKYSALVAAAYGMSLGDIGLQTTTSSGETLAGSIRQERRTRKTGFARAKAKWKAFIEAFLPDTLEFTLIDYDDELNVAMGRARLASATAFNIWSQMGAFSRQEIRTQSLQDGLLSITVPDQLPEDAQPVQTGKPPERPSALGPGTPASSGGEGEVKQSLAYSFVDESLRNEIISNSVRKVLDFVEEIGDDDVYLLKSYGVDAIKELDVPKKAVLKIGKPVLVKLGIPGDAAGKLKSEIEKGSATFLAKSAAVVTMEVLSKEEIIDNEHLSDYDYIVQEVKSRMANLKDYMDVFVSDLVQTELDKIRKDN